jgi:hypothetical protein
MNMRVRFPGPSLSKIQPSTAVNRENSVDDTSTAAGKGFLDMLGVFAEFRDEPAEGTPARGYREGANGARVRAFKAREGRVRLRKLSKSGRASVYRALEADD